MSDRGAFLTIARAAAPLCVITFAASAGSQVDTALLGRTVRGSARRAV